MGNSLWAMFGRRFLRAVYRGLVATPGFLGYVYDDGRVRGFIAGAEDGAKLMRRENRLGRLAPGFAADLVLLNLERLTWPWVAPEADPRDLILMRARADDVHTVLVDGEVVLRDGRPTRFDAAAAGAELARRMATTAIPEQADAIVERLLPMVEAHYKGWETPELAPYSCYNSKT